MTTHSLDSFQCRSKLQVDGKTYDYFSLPKAEAAGVGDLSKLPFSLKVLLENLLRLEDGQSIQPEDIKALANWANKPPEAHEIVFRPARVLMQDFTGVPAVCDLAAMRTAVTKAGHAADIVNPLSPVDLVIDHSVMVDRFGSDEAFNENTTIEMERNAERYQFLRWGQKAFKNFRVVPPGTGICHQVNLEFLAKTVWTEKQQDCTLAYPDTLVGTDSHTTMINALGVLGWGVGGIEAEAAMLGQPISMLIPEVIGVSLTGSLAEGVTATDLVLTIVEMLRKRGVVGKFVEFFGNGLDHLSLADRATISNMAPEYGATCGFFPVDQEVIAYMKLSGRDAETCALVEAYCKAQKLWRTPDHAPTFTDVSHLKLDDVRPSLAGPKRPQDRVPMSGLKEAFASALNLSFGASQDTPKPDQKLHHGDVVIAAITSCTNTSNPAVMLSAGLVAKKALERGLKVQPWVKTSLAPGSKVVTEYLEQSGLQTDLDALGFHLVGYGCTTCIGNSGPLPEAVSAAIEADNLVVASVLSGNRNFEGRVHQEVKTNWLASPPLVVAYALAGSVNINLDQEPIGQGTDGVDVYLKDIWPTQAEIKTAVEGVTAEMFRTRYADVYKGPKAWRQIKPIGTDTYDWPISTYIAEPPFFVERQGEDQNIRIQDARVLAIFGDSLTTDHISPAGAIAEHSPAGQYLQSLQVAPMQFNSYGSRRGNHEVMMRGTFANIRIRNEMVPDTEGGYTKNLLTGEEMSIYEAAMAYKAAGTPLVVVAGKEYGTGSSRDWAAKGTLLLGVKAVIVESFERIHRSNLVGMGVLPLQFEDGVSRTSLGLVGTELLSIDFVEPGDIRPGQQLKLTINRDGDLESVHLRSRLDTDNEVAYFKSGGILHYVLRQLQGQA